MARVVGILVGLVLLLPAAIVIFIRSGGDPNLVPLWLAAVAHIAYSIPMLALFSIAGVAVIALSIRAMLRDRDS